MPPGNPGLGDQHSVARGRDEATELLGHQAGEFNAGPILILATDCRQADRPTDTRDAGRQNRTGKIGNRCQSGPENLLEMRLRHTVHIQSTRAVVSYSPGSRSCDNRNGNYFWVITYTSISTT